MKDYKLLIANLIKNVINIDVYNYIGSPKNDNGDYAFPCFSISKEFGKSPVEVAEFIIDKIEKVDYIEKIENVNGYLNFYINKEDLIKEVLNDFDTRREKFGSEINDKTVLLDYSAPNIAKPFHIGHLRSTVIGNALYKTYKFLGYNTVGINHLGDYGTQFGKLIEGYKLWGNEYNIEENPIDTLTEIYVRINKLCEEDEEVLERCRNNFKLLEDKDEYCTELWNRFKDLSLKEFNKTYELLGVTFDSYLGEAFYADKVDEVEEILRKNGKLTESENALVVDLTSEGINTPCIIKKSNGSSIYATRDLAAILYRARTYDYDECIYTTSYEQNLHFRQVFATAKYLDLDEKYTNGLSHVPFGMVLLDSGKLSTRQGNIIKLDDILNEAITRAKNIILEKNPELEDIDETAKKVGVGSVIFNDLYNSRIKDEVFDYDIMLNFQGETCPYIQYMYVRIQSILNKTEDEVLLKDVSYDKLTDDLSYSLIRTIYDYNKTLNEVIKKKEPYILSRYLIKLANEYSSFYSNNKVLDDNDEIRKTRLYLISMVGEILKSGMNLLGIEMPNKM